MSSKGRKFKYPIKVFWSEEDEGYIALVPDLPGCSAWAKQKSRYYMKHKTHKGC